MRSALSLLPTLALAACDLLVDPGLPKGAVRYDPPARYELWWEMVQSCSSRTGDLRHVTWYQVPDATQLPVSSGHPGSVTGVWYRKDNSIVMAGASVLKGDEVRHEMLHALVHGPGHPREEFQERCGGIVSCGTACQGDGGGAPVVPADAPTIPADSLHLRIEVVPRTGVFARDSGAVAVVLTATNPYAHPVWVPIGWRLIFGPSAVRVRIDPRDGSESIFGPPNIPTTELGFLAGANRRYVFDFTLPPGAYTVHGFFFGVRTDSVAHVVAP